MNNEIKALISSSSFSRDVELFENHQFEFGYSRTGNVKFNGKRKAKYFKKETLNSYEPIEFGGTVIFLFTGDFEIDKNKCYRSILEFFISSSNSKIEALKKNTKSLEEQLSNY